MANFLKRSAAMCLAATVLTALPATAQELTFFRIGTGSTGGVYFPIGGLLAGGISSPPGSRECNAGGSCGVRGLVAVVQSTRGSVDNVFRIRAGQIESALSQADIAYWAHQGKEVFEAGGAHIGLRAIASLYPEVVQVVVRAESDINGIDDLKGRSVSIGPVGSGTYIDAQLILNAYGLDHTKLDILPMTLENSASELESGGIDAFFFVGGYPTDLIVELATTTPIRLAQITGQTAAKIRDGHPFFGARVIPSGQYEGVGNTNTLSVNAQWVVSSDVSEALVYGITRALWHPSTLRYLSNGHSQAKRISRDRALEGLAIPLHRGAARFYREEGMLPEEGADTTQ